MKASSMLPFTLVVSSLLSPLQAGRVILDTIASDYLGEALPYIVVLPDSYEERRSLDQPFPVVYFLHCAGCSHDTWLGSGYAPGFEELVDTVEIIAVSPADGSQWGRRFSWWLDSPRLADYQTSSFLTKELKPRIDSLYATIPSREATGLSGHSMGGYGALHNILEHPDLFGAAFSMKGGLDASYPHNPNWPSSFGMYDLIGTDSASAEDWRRANILARACEFKGSGSHVGFFVGKLDSWFYQENAELHRLLDSCEFDHCYWETDDTHFNVPYDDLRKAMFWFDSVFAPALKLDKRQGRRSPALRVSPARGGRSLGADAALLTIRGRRVGGAVAGESLSAGIYFVASTDRATGLQASLVRDGSRGVPAGRFRE